MTNDFPTYSPREREMLAKIKEQKKIIDELTAKLTEYESKSSDRLIPSVTMKPIRKFSYSGSLSLNLN